MSESNEPMFPRRGGLVEQNKNDPEEEKLSKQIGVSLDETELRVRQLLSDQQAQMDSWHLAREIVENFKPVPWFIWRLANYVLLKPGRINEVPEGMLLGLRRLLFAAASDPILGAGKPVNEVRRAMSILSSDVIATVAVMHSICRRLATKDFKRIWHPILEDALLRAEIGFLVGSRHPSFGGGRGMLAGFSGRVGLAVTIASGSVDNARDALEGLASGGDIGQVGMGIYGCDPLQVSAMLLSASGCGRDAAWGTVGYAARNLVAGTDNDEQRLWLSAFSICELVRLGRSAEIAEETWNALNFTSDADRDQITQYAQKLVRQGTSWSWLS